MKKGISEDYETFKSHKFSKSSLDKNESLGNIMMSSIMLAQCIRYARMVFNRGQYENSMKMINILYAIVYEPADILNLSWAKLVGS